jgi:hypothetical protein
MNSIKVLALLVSTDIKVLAPLQIGTTKNEQTHVEYCFQGQTHVESCLGGGGRFITRIGLERHCDERNPQIKGTELGEREKNLPSL